MEAIITMVKRLCLLTTLSLLLRTILPKGEVQKYAEFAMALIEMCVLAEPILGLISRFR